MGYCIAHLMRTRVMDGVYCVRGVCLPVSVRGPPPQRYARAKCTVPHCAHTAPQSLDCVRVRSLPGPAHFASLRSARGRWAARLARARGGFRRASTPPPRIRLHPRGAIHPPLRRAWLGRDASLRQSHPSRRRLAPRGTGFALAPWQARLAPCALSAPVRFCGARSAPLTVSKVSALVRNCAESSPFTLSPCQ